MTEASGSQDSSTVTPLESFPDGSLPFDQLEVFEEADAIELAAPLVLETSSDRVTHLDLVIDDTHYYAGWNPGEEQWERILVMTDKEGEPAVVQDAATLPDRNENSEHQLHPDSEPSAEDIAAFTWSYVESTYPDTTGLQNIIGQAAEEFDEE